MNKLDNSLRTLAKVLIDLKKSQKPTKNHLYYSTTPSLAMEYPIKVETINNEYANDDDDNIKSVPPLKHTEGKSFCRISVDSNTFILFL